MLCKKLQINKTIVCRYYTLNLLGLPLPLDLIIYISKFTYSPNIDKVTKIHNSIHHTKKSYVPFEKFEYDRF